MSNQHERPRREDFEYALGKGIVKFNYTKKDGTPRDATGTLHPSKLPAMPTDPDVLASMKEKSDSFKTANPDMVKYWDLEANGFRSVSMSNLGGYALVESL